MNDGFGLSASGTPGGQTNAEPISLDAIEEFNVAVAPFDVRQGGFTGGLINAITRSGSNKFHGSTYFYGRNQNLVGSSPDAYRKSYADFEESQCGGRLGGPIFKDKVFFFVSGEYKYRNDPYPLSYNDPLAAVNFPVSAATMQAIR